MKSMPRARQPDPDAKLFGEFMFRMRARRGWSLDDLGRHSGMHPDFLGLLERGLNVPSLTTILRIAETFGVPPGEIVDTIQAGRSRRLAPPSSS
jgi:transcriptional regulator with XRE-family HTH domain